jgi:predicted DNA-binding protein
MRQAKACTYEILRRRNIDWVMQMALTATERIRLSPVEARHLREVARKTGRTKSDVLRAGLEAEWQRLQDHSSRERAWDELVRHATEVPGTPKAPLRTKE